jgi:hypothetical protein
MGYNQQLVALAVTFGKLSFFDGRTVIEAEGSGLILTSNPGAQMVPFHLVDFRKTTAVFWIENMTSG